MVSGRRGVSAVSSMRLDGRDTTRDTPGHHQSAPVPNTAQNQPGSPAQHLIRSIQSFCCCPHTQDSNSACRTRTPPTHPDKPFGVYDARDRPLLPSFLSFTHNTHTLCALLRPTTQSAAYTATKGERREFLAWGETCQRAPAYISLGEGHEGSSSHTGVVTAGQRRGDRKIVACAGGWVGEEKRPSWHLFPTLLIPFQARYGRWPAVAKLGMTSPAWHGTCPVLSFPLPSAPVVASRKNYSAGRSFFVSLHR